MRLTVFALLTILSFQLNAQFHTLTMPKPSPAASMTQQVGVTFVKISYHSPSTYGREVWTNPGTIPQNGDPIPWRAGANENTTISFDTDVKIEGQTLKAGSYGFHIIPNGHEHTLLFARPDNLWGSYYLDVDNDVVLRVTVKDTASDFHEYLTYAVVKRQENSCQFALKWADRMIPFTVSVDLPATAVEKWRYELNGTNTYQWEAWNDAAAWCVSHQTNLEEALTWVNRSINGGYGGFAGHLSFVNLSTKIEILDALGRTDELEEILQGLGDEDFTADEAHYMGATLLKLKQDQIAADLMSQGLKQHPEDWGMMLYRGVAHYFLGNQKTANKALDLCETHCPEQFKPRLDAIRGQMKEGNYQFPQRKS
ncbi:DUF2911 domain-containing protein [bacterium SCSIO 12741]|nr:DUF2911 domain-containing protein [bacterium SCSIO 12741]